jgi:D-beta-D-heptose 7-phosphate kinase/D-beta-D-heptose 1-phosphate adenosyltransferase
MITIMVSGGFDPIHDGHIEYLHAASLRGHVIVALNSDTWLKKKKGYIFLPWKARQRVLAALIFVDQIVRVDDADGTVCEVLKRLKPDYFANGGDRTEANPMEHAICHEFGITELFNVGGPKTRSSSDLVKVAR